jgi:hypothetical protein
MPSISRLAPFLAPAAALLLAVPARAQVYANTFESGVLGAEWSGAGSIQTTGGLSAFGFGANHLKNDGAAATVLSLSGLAPHTTLSLAFDLAMWDSIDLGSDIFRVFVDGTPLFDGTFGNYFPASGVCEGPGTLITDPFTDFATPNYGHNAGFRDCGRAVTFSLAHSASTATLSWQFPNSQTAPDESFGIDNVVVRTNARVSAVPEPGTWALLATGLVALGGVARRRRGA